MYEHLRRTTIHPVSLNFAQKFISGTCNVKNARVTSMLGKIDIFSF